MFTARIIEQATAGVNTFEMWTDIVDFGSDLGELDVPGYKMAFGPEGEITLVSATDPLPVTIISAATSTVTIDSGSLSALELVGVKGMDGAAITSMANPIPTVDQDPAGHLFLSGASLGNAFTLDATDLDLTGDSDERIAIQPRNYLPLSAQTLMGKWQTAGNQRSWATNLNTNGTITFQWSTAGTNASVLSATSTVRVPFSDGVLGLIRRTIDVDDGSGNRVITFYYKNSVPKRAYRDCLDDGGWTQLGDAVTAVGTTSIFSGTASVVLGNISGGGTEFNGRIYAYALKSGIGLATGFTRTAVNFADKARWNRTTTSALDHHGHTWTIFSPGVIQGTDNLTAADDAVTATLATGSLIGVKGGDGSLIASAANPFPITANRYSGEKTPVVATVTASGDTTIHTPAAGKAIRLYWISAINDPDEATNPLIKVFIGATELYRVYAFAHWEVFEGAADEVLKINLSGAASVAVTAHIEEFTP